MKEGTIMLKLSIHDQRALVSEAELTAAIAAGLPMLARAQTGEAQYANEQGWLHVDEWASEEVLTRIEDIAANVRATCDAFVLIGVGGSNNAARSVIEALADGSGPQIVYAGNTLSANAMNRMLKQLEGKRFAVDCIAKNFETLEPGASFRVLRRMLSAQYTPEESARRVICTGTIGSALEKLCKEEGYTFVPFPTNIGGRYTAMSYVGLLPMAVAGIDVRALVRGAADMARTLHTGAPEENLALRYAVLRNLYYQHGYKMELLASFEPQLRWFYKWWVQLFAENEGKDGKGLFPTAAEYSEELHAVGQYIQDGAPLMFETFLDIEARQDSLVVMPDGKKDYFDYLDGKDYYDINKAAFSATVTAHSAKLPCLVFEVPALDAYNFGQMFYFFQFACYISGSLLGVNPFNQPGVEAYKRWMFQALGK